MELPPVRTGGVGIKPAGVVVVASGLAYGRARCGKVVMGCALAVTMALNPLTARFTLRSPRPTSDTPTPRKASVIPYAGRRPSLAGGHIEVVGAVVPIGLVTRIVLGHRASRRICP